MACSAPTLWQSKVTLENMFLFMAKKGDPKAEGRSISQEVVEQWLTKADPKITQGDVATAFQKLEKPVVDFSEFNNMISELAKSKEIDLKSLKAKLLKVQCPCKQ